MAVFTREDAKNSARVAKNEGGYYVVTWLNRGFDKIGTRTLPSRKYSLEDVLLLKNETGAWLSIVISDKSVRKVARGATTVKELENVIYLLVNSTINEQHNSFLKMRSK